MNFSHSILFPFSAKFIFECVLSGEKTQEGHLNFQPLVCDLKYEGLQIQMNNLFNGNEAATRATNAAINQNIQLFLDQIGPTFSASLVQSVQYLPNQVWSNLDYNEVFPL